MSRLRLLFNSLTDVWSYNMSATELDLYGMDEWHAGQPEYAEVIHRSRLFIGLWDTAKMMALTSVCVLRGHRWTVESNCGPESGSEDFYCERCGYSHHICYY